jgi:ribosome-associated toxin RatA of RatAB toxin-antitoxin module
MAEQTSGSIDIGASPEEIMEVITDFDAYPEWAGVKTTKILKKDSKGRPSEVAMEVSQMGFEAKYTLAYTYAAKNGGASWTTKEASGVLKDISGQYALEPEGETTKVTYHLTLELGISLPGFMRRQAEKQVVNTALGGLKKQVESDR